MLLLLAMLSPSDLDIVILSLSYRGCGARVRAHVAGPSVSEDETSASFHTVPWSAWRPAPRLRLLARMTAAGVLAVLLFLLLSSYFLLLLLVVVVIIIIISSLLLIILLTFCR